MTDGTYIETSADFVLERLSKLRQTLREMVLCERDDSLRSIFEGIENYLAMLDENVDRLGNDSVALELDCILSGIMIDVSSHLSSAR